jgi:hypothetical protein
VAGIGDRAGLAERATRLDSNLPVEYLIPLYLDDSAGGRGRCPVGAAVCVGDLFSGVRAVALVAGVRIAGSITLVKTLLSRMV